MEITVKSRIQVEQRTLAAIVFTDVVSYSRHAQINETKAIRNFQRDLEIITNSANKYSGKVLKTLGDGVLIQFSSAMQALQCAIDIQESLFQQSLITPVDDVLDHRIGVHLGDVLVTESDILGDGVNVANRLQAEANPGSIFFSRTVYDVINGKFSFNARYIGPIALKGIKEPVVVWEIPPKRKQEINKRIRSLATFMPANEKVVTRVQTLRGMGLSLLAFAGIALLVLAFTKEITVGHKRQKMISQTELHRGQRVLKLDSQSRESLSNTHIVPKASVIKGFQSKPVGNQITSNESPRGTENINNRATERILMDHAMFSRLKPLFESYEFNKMEKMIKQSNYATTPDGIQAIAKYKALSNLMDWENSQLNLAFESNPITLASWPPLSQEVTIYRADPLSIVVKVGANPTTIALTSLSINQTTALDQALLKVPGSTVTTSKETIKAEIATMKLEESRFK